MGPNSNVPYSVSGGRWQWGRTVRYRSVSRGRLQSVRTLMYRGLSAGACGIGAQLYGTLVSTGATRSEAEP